MTEKTQPHEIKSIEVSQKKLAELLAFAGSAEYVRSITKSIDFASDKALALSGCYDKQSCLELCEGKADVMKAIEILEKVAVLLDDAGLD